MKAGTKSTLTVLLAGFSGAAAVLALAVVWVGQYRASMVISRTDEFIPPIVDSLSAMRDLQDPSARHELEFVLDRILSDRTDALKRGRLWLLAHPYPAIDHIFVADKILDRYFESAQSDLTESSELDENIIWRRQEYLDARVASFNEYARAYTIGLACEQMAWWVPNRRCPSWSEELNNYDPDHRHYMHVLFYEEPEGELAFSHQGDREDGLHVRFVGSELFLEGVIWAKYETTDGRDGFLPHTRLGMPPTTLNRLLR